MPSVRQIARRIRSVENTAKITKAMSMIAASKLRRTQDAATQGRAYSEKMSEIVTSVSSSFGDDENQHPLSQQRDVVNAALVFITPDRGLTGGLNSNLIRKASDFINETTAEVKLISFGKKGNDFGRRSGLEIIEGYTGITDRPTLSDTKPVSQSAIASFENERVDEVYVCYAKFVNTTLQRAIIEKILPVIPSGYDGITNQDYIFEPTPAEVMQTLLPRYVETLIHQSILEAGASEQSARMVAMNQATDNANAMVDDLTLLMNKLRQETITKELLDIVGGVSAVEN